MARGVIWEGGLEGSTDPQGFDFNFFPVNRCTFGTVLLLQEQYVISTETPPMIIETAPRIY